MQSPYTRRRFSWMLGFPAEQSDLNLMPEDVGPGKIMQPKRSWTYDVGHHFGAVANENRTYL
jgi:hypothetical protein